MSTGPHSDRENGSLPLPVRLYPASYRRANGAEAAATYADVTEGAGLAVRAAEAAGLTGHALRMRAGLTSDRTFPRVAALAAPIVVAVSAGLSAAQLFRVADSEPPGTLDGLGRLAGLPTGWAWGTGLLMLAVLLAAVSGRWTLAKVLGCSAAVAILAVRVIWFSAHMAEMLVSMLTAIVLDVGLPQVLWAVLLVAAPKDLLDDSPRTRATLPAVAVGTYAVATIGWREGPLSWLPLFAALVAVALAFNHRDRLFPAAVALAVLPLLLITYTSELSSGLILAGVTYDLATLVSGIPLLGAAVAIVLMNRRGRRGSTAPSTG
ncbi:hypothetical protein [Streptomyces tsukubensis]|uniref:Uncharacterized protein n=1 Tax=Streptomyces tsukubensis TaxID=83656 RepID=A0A1V4A633_9ACTN|nr:hypothetical protein [Streptomyces tsukubensis]OON77291.1 hypothetical protein B1H18_18750 [Streptomyces tsukubensis]QFR92365.1 hypothetical protein GBW32_03975 [Streptomyces tsukubensis]